MKLKVAFFALAGMAIAAGINSMAQAQGNSFSGTVERVWEDGFRLKTEERSLRVDSWNICGDKTPSNLSQGDQVSVNGEFDGGEFDAFSITIADKGKICTGKKNE